MIWITAALPAMLLGMVAAHTADAQSQSRPRIGVLTIYVAPESKLAERFRSRLQQAGYVPGRDVELDWRWTNADYAQVPQLAADLVKRGVDIIVAESTVSARAAKQTTSTIPMVMAPVADPVGSGLVSNLAHPEANLTGLSLMTAELGTKRLELLKETLPRVKRVAILWNPDTPWHRSAIEQLKGAAARLGLEPSFVAVARREQFAAAFAAIAASRAQVVYIVDDPVAWTHRKELVDLVLKARLPVVCGSRDYPAAGALMSYQANVDEVFLRSADYVVRILKGAKPADLPIEQPTQFQLVVNLKAARKLGIQIPEALVVRADEVIR